MRDDDFAWYAHVASAAAMHVAMAATPLVPMDAFCARESESETKRVSAGCGGGRVSSAAACVGSRAWVMS